MEMTSIRLCQWNDGPPICVRSTRQNVEIAAWELEDHLKAHLSSLEEESVEIQMRTDPHLLGAVRPSVPIETITGVWEDTLSNPTLQVTVWQAVDDFITEDTKCKCQEIHSEWTRVPLKEQKTDDFLDTVPVKWVDVRNAKNLSLSTLAGCCHFLRTVLGTSHATMPWGDSNETLPSVVALLLPRGAASEMFSTFRIGDAAPSYFLHSVSQLQLPANSTALWWLQKEPPDKVLDAMLFIYKTVPPRETISIHYPLNTSTSETLPDGCLWECYTKHADDDDDDERKDEHARKEKEEEEDCRILCPPYISHTQDYPGLLEPLLQHLSTLQEEAKAIPRWTAWPERQHYKSSLANGNEECWTVFPLCHCFPANVVENRKWIDVTCAHVPKTVALLKDLLGDTLRTALFSRLDPETTLEVHTGWSDLANYVIRVHIPLLVPDGGLCGTWVDGCVETHQQGRPLCFDDAKNHRAFNYSKQERVVLILDLARPSYLPLGHATGGHTEELDSFINSLT